MVHTLTHVCVWNTCTCLSTTRTKFTCASSTLFIHVRFTLISVNTVPGVITIGAAVIIVNKTPFWVKLGERKTCKCSVCSAWGTGHALKPDKSLHLPAVFAVLSPHTHGECSTGCLFSHLSLPLSLFCLSHDRWVCKAFPPGWWALFRELSRCKWSHEYEPNGAGFVLQER